MSIVRSRACMRGRVCPSTCEHVHECARTCVCVRARASACVCLCACRPSISVCGWQKLRRWIVKMKTLSSSKAMWITARETRPTICHRRADVILHGRSAFLSSPPPVGQMAGLPFRLPFFPLLLLLLLSARWQVCLSFLSSSCRPDGRSAFPAAFLSSPPPVGQMAGLPFRLPFFPLLLLLSARWQVCLSGCLSFLSSSSSCCRTDGRSAFPAAFLSSPPPPVGQISGLRRFGWDFGASTRGLLLSFSFSFVWGTGVFGACLFVLIQSQR